MAPRALSRMSSASPSSQCGFRVQVAPPAGASAPTSPTSGCSRGSCSPHVRTVTLASSPPTGTSGIGRVRDAQEQVVERGLDLGQRRVERRRSARRPRSMPAFSSATSGPSGAAPPLIASPIRLRGRVALRLERLALGQQPPALGVELERPVDERRVLALVDGALADGVGLVAEPLQADAHAAPPRSPSAAPPRAAARARTPDRGWPAASPHAARSSGRGRRGRSPRMPGRPAGPVAVAASKIASCHASPPAGGSRREPRSASARQERRWSSSSAAASCGRARRWTRDDALGPARRSRARRARPPTRSSRIGGLALGQRRSPSPPRPARRRRRPGSGRGARGGANAGRKAAASAATSASGSRSE